MDIFALKHEARVAGTLATAINPAFTHSTVVDEEALAAVDEYAGSDLGPLVLVGKTVQVRVKCLSYLGEELIGCHYHRTSIAPGASAEAQMAAVNVHLKSMGIAPCDDGEIAKVLTFVEQVRKQ